MKAGPIIFYSSELRPSLRAVTGKSTWVYMSQSANQKTQVGGEQAHSHYTVTKGLRKNGIIYVPYCGIIHKKT